MATFLQLVNDLERESGTIEARSRLTTVVGATGRQEKIVEWIVEAWRLIQTCRNDWPWMEKEFSHALTVDQARYTAAQLTLTDFSNWARVKPDFEPFSIYDATPGLADETELNLVPYVEWRKSWDRGVHDALRPSHIAVDHERRLCLGPTPDKAYVLRGSYVRSPQILSADAHVPICPEEHHMVIVWRAKMLMGDFDGDGTAVATGKANFDQTFRAMVDDTLPQCYI